MTKEKSPVCFSHWSFHLWWISQFVMFVCAGLVLPVQAFTDLFPVSGVRRCIEYHWVIRAGCVAFERCAATYLMSQPFLQHGLGGGQNYKWCSMGSGMELVLDELQVVPQDARVGQPRLSCWGSGTGTGLTMTRVSRKWKHSSWVYKPTNMQISQICFKHGDRCKHQAITQIPKRCREVWVLNDNHRWMSIASCGPSQHLVWAIQILDCKCSWLIRLIQSW